MALKLTRIILPLLLISVAVLSFQQASVYGVPPSSGQVLWWRFNEGTGATATDSSGNGNTGTLTNSPTWVTGFPDAYAIRFIKGTHELVTTTANPSSLDITGKHVSVCVWLNTTETPSDHEVIVEKGENEVGSYGLFLEIGGRVLWQINWFGVTSVGTVNDGNWHHICGTYDGTLGSNQEKIYIDNSQDAHTGFATGNIGHNSHYFTAGGFHTSTSYQLTSTVDEVMVYNRTLTPNDVSQIYNYGFQTTVTTTTTVTSTVTTTSNVTSTVTIPTTTTSTVTNSTTVTVTSPTTIHHTVTTTAPGNVTFVTYTHTVANSTITTTVTTTHPTTATVTTTSHHTTTVIPTSTTYTATMNSTRTFSVYNTTRTFSAYNTTDTYNVTQTVTATSTSTTGTAESSVGIGWGFIMIGIGVAGGVLGAGAAYAVTHKPTPPMPPYIPAGFIQPQPAQPTYGGRAPNPSEHLRQQRGY